MRVRRIPDTETYGYCNDCHNRARVELTVSRGARTIRLCDRCAGFVIINFVQAGVALPLAAAVPDPFLKDLIDAMAKKGRPKKKNHKE